MNSLFNSVLETASFLKSEVKKNHERKKIKITITLDDDNVALYGENTQYLTEDDIIDSIEALVSFAKSRNLIWEGDSTDGNA